MKMINYATIHVLMEKTKSSIYYEEGMEIRED